MKVFKKLLFVSVAATGLLFACPDMGPGIGPKHGKGEGMGAPRGVVKELYDTASLKQKRDILQIEFDARKAEKTQTEKFREYQASVEFDIKNLYLDLEAAKEDRNIARATEILYRITKKQEELRRSKQDEQNLRYLLEEDKLKKISNVLRVK